MSGPSSYVEQSVPEEVFHAYGTLLPGHFVPLPWNVEHFVRDKVFHQGTLQIELVDLRHQLLAALADHQPLAVAVVRLAAETGDEACA